MTRVWEFTTIALRLWLFGTCALLPLASAGAAADPPPAAAPAGAASQPGLPAPPSAAAPRAGVPGAPATAHAPWTDAAVKAVPQFLPGLWEYRHTTSVGERGEPHLSVTRRCGNPTEEIRQNLNHLGLKGCQLSSTTHRGKLYETSWICAAPGGGTISIHNQLTFTGINSYHDESEMHRGQQVTYSSTIAMRVGACPAPGAGAPGAPGTSAPAGQPPPAPAK
jgi:hypothetical protein